MDNVHIPKAEYEQLLKHIKELEIERDAFKRARILRIEQLEAQLDAVRKLLRDINLMAKPVAATSKNTSAVRTGHEMGGYIKHYIVPTHLITASENALNGEDDG